MNLSYDLCSHKSSHLHRQKIFVKNCTLYNIDGNFVLKKEKKMREKKSLNKRYRNKVSKIFRVNIHDINFLNK